MKQKIGVLGMVIILIAALSIGIPHALAVQSKAPKEQIAFASKSDGDFEIYLMDTDGNIFSKLTDNRATDLWPSWSPDGTHLAYMSNVNGSDYEIYVVDVTTGVSVNLTNNGADDYYPAWSPNGDRIAFTTNRDLNWEIYTMDTSGGNLTRLTHSNIYEGNPAWSPDGKQIAYVADRNNASEIRIMNADGSNVENVTHNDFVDQSPAWSPDGTHLAFVSKRTGSRSRSDIFVIDLQCLNSAEGCDASAVNVTQPEGGVDPAWSPDGSSLIFTSGRDGTPDKPNSDLYIMKFGVEDISQAHRLTTEAGDDRFPAWWGPK